MPCCRARQDQQDRLALGGPEASARSWSVPAPVRQRDQKVGAYQAGAGRRAESRQRPQGQQRKSELGDSVSFEFPYLGWGTCALLCRTGASRGDVVLSASNARRGADSSGIQQISAGGVGSVRASRNCRMVQGLHAEPRANHRPTSGTGFASEAMSAVTGETDPPKENAPKSVSSRTQMPGSSTLRSRWRRPAARMPGLSGPGSAPSAPSWTGEEIHLASFRVSPGGAQARLAAMQSLTTDKRFSRAASSPLGWQGTR